MIAVLEFCLDIILFGATEMWNLCDSGVSLHLAKFILGISHLGERSVSQTRTEKQPTNQPKNNLRNDTNNQI